MPFALPAVAPIVPNPIGQLRTGGGIVLPPPPPVVQTSTPSSKPKTKEYHIFKLLPKLPIGCVTIARTPYSSRLFSSNFEKKLLTELSDEL